MVCAFDHILETMLDMIVCDISNERANYSVSHDINEIINSIDIE